MVQHRERPIADAVETQLPLDEGVGAAQDASAVRRHQQIGLFGRDRAIVDQRKVDVELRIRADARDFRRADAAREDECSAGRAAAIAAQDGLRGDDVRYAIDLHQPQRAFLIEHRAHDGREAIDLRDHRIAGRMQVTRVVGVVLER